MIIMVREHSRTVHGPDRWYQVRRTSFVVELYVVRSLSFRGTSNTVCRVATGGDGGSTGICVELLLLLRWILDDDDDDDK